MNLSSSANGEHAITSNVLTLSTSQPNANVVQTANANKLVATRGQGVVNVDKFGNVISLGNSPAVTIKASHPQRIEPSNRLSISKTYGKKPATVITVPVTATVDKFRSEHVVNTTTTANPQLSLVGKTIVTPQTLLTTSIASPKSITLKSNTVPLTSNPKTTIQLLNVSAHGNTTTVPVSSSTTAGQSPIKLQSNIEVIKSSSGIPIKLVRGPASGGTVQTVGPVNAQPQIISRPMVQKVQQASPSVTSQGNIMRIISDKSVQLSSSGWCVCVEIFMIIADAWYQAQTALYRAQTALYRAQIAFYYIG